MSDMLRRAMSEHDTHAPLTVVEMLQLANEMAAALIEHECQFSHPDWRYVDGLRALALREEYRDAERPAVSPEAPHA